MQWTLYRTTMASGVLIGGTVGAVLISIVSAGGAVAQVSPNDAPAVTACQMRLTADRAAFKPLGEISGPGGCGGPDVVRLERIILADRTEIAVEPPATLRCEMAEAIVYFVRQDLAPVAARMGAALSAIENYNSYDCRGRNRVSGAILSQHGLANALDIRSVRLKDGRVVRPADAAAPMEFRVAMKAAVCNRFTTVLGPGSDGYHEDHIHVDLAQRSGGHRLCQWDLHDESHTYAVQSATAPTHTSIAALPGPIPLPRSRPFDAGSAARANSPTVEGRHR